MSVRDAGVLHATRDLQRRGMPPSDVRFIPGGDRCAILAGRCIEVWDVAAGRLCHTVRHGQYPTGAWAALADEQFLLGVPRDGLRLVDAQGSTVRRFDLPAAAARFLGGERGGFEGPARGAEGMLEYPAYSIPCSIATDAEGAIAAVAYGQQFALVWNVATAELVACLGFDRGAGPGERVYRTDVSPDGRTVLTRSACGRLRTWDWQSAREVGHFGVATDPPPRERGPLMVAGVAGVGPAVLVQGGASVAVAAGARVHLYAVDGGAHLGTWVGHGDEHPILERADLPRICEIRTACEGRRAVTAGVDGSLRLWDVGACEQVWTVTPDPCCFDGVDVSADGTRIVWTGCPGTRLYSLHHTG